MTTPRLAKHIFFVFTCLTLSVISSSAKEYNIKSVSFNKGIYQVDQRPINGQIIDYYENEQLKFRYTVLEGRLHGKAIEFFPNGTIKAERNYIFGKLFGEYVLYFKNGSQHLTMTVERNRYGQGEEVVDIRMAKKPGRKLKKLGDGYILFFDQQGNPYKSSENLPIEEQSNFKLYHDDQEIYRNLIPEP